MIAADGPDDWFLSPESRGNPDTTLDSRHDDGNSWTSGNLVRPLIHGRTYFTELLQAVGKLDHGDLLLFTDWRGDADEHLDEYGSEVGDVFAAAASRGADVRGLLWRSHLALQYGTAKNRGLGNQVEDAGGQVLLDMRVPKFGSHHQKLVVLRYRRRPADDVAFIGGIDLCHGRRDDANHLGDPQAMPMSSEYGANPPWHDIQLAIHGPAVGDAEVVFRERWDDPGPLSRQPVYLVSSWLNRESKTADPLPAQAPDPMPVGSTAVQLLRTYPIRHPGYPFGRRGERSIARGYVKALARARSLVYVEDQYLWSNEVAEVYADALRRQQSLLMVFVIPRYPDQDGRLSKPPNQLGRADALDILRDAGGERFSVYDLENASGTPVYVHAKACVIDDRWACVGSDNTNRRSWTNDTELSAAFVDESADGQVRALRLALAAEHLGTDPERVGLMDPPKFYATLQQSARALDDWHQGGQVGPRPTGQLRVFSEKRLRRRTRLWARPLYRVIYDPDGRPLRMRRARAF
jgi:phosphatidylserine/phosphatidylglycerophosphate/cardiolipin synthase-like enzyme